jgi:hypothetical protein
MIQIWIILILKVLCVVIGVMVKQWRQNGKAAGSIARSEVDANLHRIDFERFS